MNTMTYEAPRFWERKHHFAATATMVVLFWAIAAVLVAIVHELIDPISPAGCEIVKVGAVVLTAFAYIKLTAREATVDHALLAGFLWIALTIAAEMAATMMGGHGWFELLGSPARPLLRDMLVLVWLGAPALFARGRS